MSQGTASETMTPAAIPGLLGTATFDLSVAVHSRHHDDGAGACAACGRPVPCSARRSAEGVILAAGQDPRGYQTIQTSFSARSGRDSSPSHEVIGGLPPWVGGFAITGRNRPLPQVGFDYDRY